jgi:hypothetical protein
MDTKVLIALLTKLVEEKIADLPRPSIGQRGHRGPPGLDGKDGKDFVFEEHESTIRAWAKEFSLKFEDLTPGQIRSLKGRDGKDGKDFVFDLHRADIEKIVSEVVTASSESLKLKFADLSADDIALLRGPRGRSGRDGKDGKDFVFEDHLEFFKSLKLKFSDLSDDERLSLTLKFSHLSAEEKEELKLKFSDLSPEDLLEIRGPRGQRGKPGRDGLNGKDGLSIRGLPGVTGPRGLQGPPGIVGDSGRDGQDAPYIIGIDVSQKKDSFTLIFEFSDGRSIESPSVNLPGNIRETYIVGSGIGRSSGGGGGSGADGNSAYEIAVENGFVGTEAEWLASLVGPQGPEGPEGPAGPEGPPGSGSTQVRTYVCSADVYVGAAVVLRKSTPSELNMSDWTFLRGLLAMNATQYGVVAENAIATSTPYANVAGIVNSISSSFPSGISHTLAHIGLTSPGPVSSCEVVLLGQTDDLYLGLDVEKQYYLSDEVAGMIVVEENKPTIPGSFLVKVGQPSDANKMIFYRGDITEII